MSGTQGHRCRDKKTILFSALSLVSSRTTLERATHLLRTSQNVKKLKTLKLRNKKKLLLLNITVKKMMLRDLGLWKEVQKTSETLLLTISCVQKRDWIE